MPHLAAPWDQPVNPYLSPPLYTHIFTSVHEDTYVYMYIYMINKSCWFTSVSFMFLRRLCRRLPVLPLTTHHGQNASPTSLHLQARTPQCMLLQCYYPPVVKRILGKLFPSCVQYFMKPPQRCLCSDEKARNPSPCVAEPKPKVRIIWLNKCPHILPHMYVYFSLRFCRLNFFWLELLALSHIYIYMSNWKTDSSSAWGQMWGEPWGAQEYSVSHVYMYVDVCVCVFTHMYIYIYIYIYTHTHIYAYLFDTADLYTEGYQMSASYAIFRIIPYIYIHIYIYIIYLKCCKAF